MYNDGFTSLKHKNYFKLKQINIVAMVTKIAIYLHFTRRKQYIGIEKTILLLHISFKYD